jgi:ribosomal protein S4E
LILLSSNSIYCNDTIITEIEESRIKPFIKFEKESKIKALLIL